MHYAGVTTTALTDGASTNPISIGGENYTAVSGDVVIYSTREYVFSDTDNKWHEFGSTGSLKALAFKDTASATYQPKGSVSSTFSGTQSSVTVTATENANGAFQVGGTVTAPVFTGTEFTSTGSYQPEGSVTVTTNTTTNKTGVVSVAASGDATYTPAGSVSATFSGTSFSSSGSFTPSGSVTLTKTNKTTVVSPADSGEASYTPAGTCSAPTITVATAGSTTTIKNPTSVTVAKTINAVAPGGTAPSNNITYYSVSGETLSLYQIGYTTGASITTENKTVKTGDATYSATQPTFTGTGVRLVNTVSTADSASFSGEAGSVSVSGVPTGSITNGTLSGTPVRLTTTIAVPNTYTGTFVGTSKTVSVSGTATGSNSAPTFTGKKYNLSGTTTATGTISSTFNGTEATITVS